MKSKWLVSLFTVLSVSNAVYASAGKEGGGGDTDAVEFITRAHDIGVWLTSSKGPLQADETSRYSEVLNDLITKMSGTVTAPIQFVEDPLVRVNGADKMAMFIQTPRLIKVSRPKWNELASHERYQLVALEMFGLANVGDRYAKAGEIKAASVEISKTSAIGSVLIEDVDVVKDECFVDVTTRNVSRCTRITKTSNSVSISTTCFNNGHILAATVSSPIVKKAGYYQALSRPKDRVSKDGLTCYAEISDFVDQSGFYMMSGALIEGDGDQVGFSGKFLVK